MFEEFGLEVLRDDALPRSVPGNFVRDSSNLVFNREGHAEELARGDIEECHSAGPLLFLRRDGREIIGCRGFEECLVHHHPRCDDANHLSPHDALRFAGILDLVSNRNPVALCDKPRDVSLDCMAGDSRKGNRVFFLIPRPGRKNDIELAGQCPGIVAKSLVKVTDMEEEDRIRVPRLQFLVLGHRRCQPCAGCLTGSLIIPAHYPYLSTGRNVMCNDPCTPGTGWVSSTIPFNTLALPSHPVQV
ncbi:MAG: hypothetical protein A4E39_00358 [Methanoregulaceae archaeon PtaB.Bin152]|nr:MAG: hypothetical protein A4E39_00358 [Methanoregulaceae archaeon PtaB.Bin152]